MEKKNFVFLVQCREDRHFHLMHTLETAVSLTNLMSSKITIDISMRGVGYNAGIDTKIILTKYPNGNWGGEGIQY